MQANVYGHKMMQAGVGACAICSDVKPKKHERDRKTKENINVCLSCKRKKCGGRCKDIDKTRK